MVEVVVVVGVNQQIQHKKNTVGVWEKAQEEEGVGKGWQHNKLERMKNATAWILSFLWAAVINLFVQILN